MRTMKVGVVMVLGAGLAAAGWGQSGAGREIAFASDGLTIPGTLLMPAGETPAAGVPLVVMVQGSGPSDRDETIGPNKVFKDLAEGLAGRGVATLRYDKRTWLMGHGKIPFNPADAVKITLETEVVDDAVAALRFASAQPGVDGRRVFLLGHSLGATLAPRIAAVRLKEAPGSVRGLIELAAGAQPASVIVPYQVAFQGIVAGKPRAEVVSSADGLAKAFAEAMDPATGAETGTALGVSAGYLREWTLVDTPGELKALGLPALVLHGQKDVQVTYLDYVLVSRAAVTAGSRSEEFAELNHLFLPVEGEGTGAEYAKAGHVAPAVMDAIAGWLPR